MTTVENKKTTRFQKYITGPGPAYSLVYCDFFGLGCIIPLLPFFCKDFDQPGVWLGGIMTSQAAGVMVGTILVGTLADCFGRKNVGVYCMFGDAIFFALAGFMEQPLPMLIVRCITGLFCPLPCGLAWLIDVSPDENVRAQRIGKIGAAILGGMFSGIVVAGLVGEFAGFTAALMIPAVFALLNGLFIALKVPDPEAIVVLHNDNNKSGEENKDSKIKKKKKPNPKKVLQTTTFKCVAFINIAVGSAVGHNQAVGMTMMVQKHKLTPGGLAVFHIITMVCMIIANVKIFPWAFKTLGPHKMFPVFLLPASIVFATSFFFEYNLYIWMVFTAIFFISAITCMPAMNMVTASLAEKHAPDAVATVQGITKTFSELGKMCSPIISVVLYGSGNNFESFYSYLWVTVILFIAAITFYFNATEAKNAVNTRGKKQVVQQKKNTEEDEGDDVEIELTDTINNAKAIVVSDNGDDKNSKEASV